MPQKRDGLPGMMLDTNEWRGFSGDFIELSGLYEKVSLKALWASFAQ